MRNYQRGITSEYQKPNQNQSRPNHHRDIIIIINNHNNNNIIHNTTITDFVLTTFWRHPQTHGKTESTFVKRVQKYKTKSCKLKKTIISKNINSSIRNKNSVKKEMHKMTRGEEKMHKRTRGEEKEENKKEERMEKEQKRMNLEQ